MPDALLDADVVMICVGTPSQRNGDQALDQLRRVCAGIREACDAVGPRQRKPLIVTVRSTVFPGTCESVIAREIGHPSVSVVCNPEFLRGATRSSTLCILR